MTGDTSIDASYGERGPLRLLTRYKSENTIRYCLHDFCCGNDAGPVFEPR